MKRCIKEREITMVSVIMPAYNSSRYIRAAIESVLQQSHRELELVVVDDCSNDNTVEVVQKYCTAYGNVRLLALKVNSGAAAARNEGLKAAKGRYVSFLDSDDVMDTDCISQQLRFMMEKNAGLVFASYQMIDGQGRYLSDPRIVPARITYRQMLRTNHVKMNGTVIDRSRFDDVLFPVEAVKREDYGLWLKLLKNAEGYGNPAILSHYRLLDGSVSSNKMKMAYYQYRVYRQVEKIGFFRSLFYMGTWAIFGMRRYSGVQRNSEEREVIA